MVWRQVTMETIGLWQAPHFRVQRSSAAWRLWLAEKFTNALLILLLWPVTWAFNSTHPCSRCGTRCGDILITRLIQPGPEFKEYRIQVFKLTLFHDLSVAFLNLHDSYFRKPRTSFSLRHRLLKSLVSHFSGFREERSENWASSKVLFERPWSCRGLG